MQLDYSISKSAASSKSSQAGEKRKTVFTLTLAGNYIGYDDVAAREKLYATLNKEKPAVIEIDGTHLEKWDSTLVIILCEITKIAHDHHSQIDLHKIPVSLRQLVDLAFSKNIQPPKTSQSPKELLVALGTWGLDTYDSFLKGLKFTAQTGKSFLRFLGSAATMRRVDFLFALEDCGPKAILIVSLISFMVGLILAFVGAIQLKLFGAQVYVASLVAIGMTRIMGAIMVGIIMAGRTGASYAAAIGTMQVNEEVDALKTMGIPTTDFLVLPRVMALTITMPILTLLADAMGIIGGMAVGVFLLDIPMQEYWKFSVLALNVRHFWVGIFHGFIFGIIIALCGCYYGIYCGRNADSVGKATTQAVVSAIVWMIVATGIITWIFMELGI